MIFRWGRKKEQPTSDAAPAPPADAAPAPDAAAQTPEAPPVEAAPAASEPAAPAEPRPTPEPEREPEPTPEPEPEPEPEKRRGFFGRLADGLRRSSTKLGDGVSAIFTKRKLDAEALDELEDLLIAADLGVGPASRVVERLAKEKFDKEVSDEEVRAALAETVSDALGPHEADLDLTGAQPQVVVFVGVNGSGKTTTLGKIAALMAREGRSVVMAAGDTFRAAAVEQLQIWGERAGAPVVAGKPDADAAGLVFDAYQDAVDRGADVLLVDTAGRLQNKAALMDELAKIMRVLKKCDADAPHHVLLVLDATVGQNALSQAAAFRETAGVSGLIMTKLDTTAKGGVLVALADAHPDLPIYFTGVGESLEDLRPFDAAAFAAALAGAAEPAPADP